jgi:nucleoside-diphosphate-sugar epimerase
MYEREWPWSAIVGSDYTGVDPAAIPQIRTSSPIRPDSAYAVGKALGEDAVRLYSDTYGLSAICLRIGTVNRADRPETPRHFATLLTHADLLRLVECALEAPEELRFGVYYGVSQNKWRFWDISDAAADIGYEPQDDAERFR